MRAFIRILSILFLSAVACPAGATSWSTAGWYVMYNVAGTWNSMVGGPFADVASCRPLAKQKNDAIDETDRDFRGYACIYLPTEPEVFTNGTVHLPGGSVIDS